ncbi:arsenate reductase/protein-tyrosine-phosphatase family protein, partial [Thioclava electrotropha]|uniref:arsenate reductase/protein-tyrosine-phosphatase family protein n=1 Tax=Thioclava electrotropha TaxID=1549850 RepID=UPI0030B8E9E7
MTPQRLTVLGHAQRLAIFRLLMRRYPDRLPAGEIGAALKLKPSTLSAYLAALSEVGLIGQTRAGTSLRYGIEMETVRSLFDALLIDCCQGRPDICSPLAQPDPSGDPAMTRSTAGRKFNVLFICTGNSARSILAETILRDRAGDRFNAYSAGTKPYSELNPFAMQVLRDKGHDVEPLRAKTIAEFQGEDAPPLDFVFTVCDLAANEEILRDHFREAAYRDGQLCDFDQFAALTARELIGIVITAHPTFGLSAELYELLAQLCSGVSPDGAELSDAELAKVRERVGELTHCPDDTIDLRQEQKLALSAIKNIQLAVRR